MFESTSTQALPSYVSSSSLPVERITSATSEKRIYLENARTLQMNEDLLTGFRGLCVEKPW